MLNLAEAGEITISITTLLTWIMGAAGAAIVIIKILARVIPAVDKFFSNPARHEEPHHHEFLLNTDHRPIIIKSILTEVPAEMVLRVSQAEKDIARVELMHAESTREVRHQFERISTGIGEIREAMASQGYQFKNQPHNR
jgi:hypothetical protein